MIFSSPLFFRVFFPWWNVGADCEDWCVCGFAAVLHLLLGYSAFALASNSPAIAAAIAIGLSSSAMQFSMKSEPLSIWPTKKGTIALWSACLLYDWQRVVQCNFLDDPLIHLFIFCQQKGSWHLYDNLESIFCMYSFLIGLYANLLIKIKLHVVLTVKMGKHTNPFPILLLMILSGFLNRILASRKLIE